MKKGKRGGKHGAGRLEPADVLQARMEYYNKLAKAEMKLGDMGSRELIGEYLKQAQDAAKELGPYRHGRAIGGADEDSDKQYVARMPAAYPFKDIDEWLLWARASAEMVDHGLKDRFERANEALVERWFGVKPDVTTRLDYKKPSDTKLN